MAPTLPSDGSHRERRSTRLRGLTRVEAKAHLRRIAQAVIFALVLGALTSVASADNTDQTNSGARYAWGENVGWISARPSAEAYAPGGTGMQVSDTDVTGYLWGENIGWINLSCMNDTSCTGPAGNWGVHNDATGNLTGYAWAENAGWISFSCQNNPSTCSTTGSYGVKIANYGVTTEHALAGKFTGYAWGENVGWISFNCSNQSSCGTVNYAVQTGAPDSDGDGYTDVEEQALAKSPFTYCAVMRADVNGDHSADILDLTIVASKFLSNVPPASARLDQDGDGHITILDLTIQASVFLKKVSTCP